MVQRRCLRSLHSSTGLPGQSLLATIWAVEPATDGELIARVGEGDSGAFELLYQRYARPVFALALRRLGDRGRAEDAVQETFTSIWRSAKSYRSDRGPGAPWLYAVARNAIVDRRRALGPVPAEPVDEPSERRRPRRTGRGQLDGLARAPRARRAPGARAEADRARVLGRPVPERDRRFRRNSPRHCQNANEECAFPARRCTGRRAVVSDTPEFQRPGRRGPPAH